MVSASTEKYDVKQEKQELQPFTRRNSSEKPTQKFVIRKVIRCPLPSGSTTCQTVCNKQSRIHTILSTRFKNVVGTRNLLLL